MTSKTKTKTRPKTKTKAKAKAKDPFDDFPARLKAARERCGYGVNELDRLVGVSVGQTSRLELGARPRVSIETVAKFARVLDVTIDWLWNGPVPSGGVKVLQRGARREPRYVPSTLRRAIGRPLEEVAEKAGIGLTNVARVEAGENATLADLAGFAKGIDMKLEVAFVAGERRYRIDV